jgi:hypothetical protein
MRSRVLPEPLQHRRVHAGELGDQVVPEPLVSTGELGSLDAFDQNGGKGASDPGVTASISAQPSTALPGRR